MRVDLNSTRLTDTLYTVNNMTRKRAVTPDCEFIGE